MKNIYSLFKNSALLMVLIGFCSFLNAQTAVDAVYTSGTFDNEVSWQIVDVPANIVPTNAFYTAGNTGAVTKNFPVTPGNLHQVRTWESFGDGWDGATLTIFAGATPLTPVMGEAQGNTPFGNGTCGACNTPNGSGMVSASFVPAIPACVIECPADVLSSTAPGTCDGGFVSIPAPTTEGCAEVATGCADVDGAVYTLNYNFTGVVPTYFDITGAYAVPANAECVSFVPVTVLAHGDLGSTPLEDIPIYDEGGNLLGGVGGSPGDCAAAGASKVFNIPVALWNQYAADGVVEFNTGTNANTDNICGTQDIQASASICTGCGSYYNDYNGGEDASDIYPKGQTVVTFCANDEAGFAVCCSFIVDVQDLEPPTLDCPGNSTVNLDAGECYTVFNYEVLASDNCPSEPFTAVGPFCDPCEDPSGGSALACAPFAQNHIIQAVETTGVAGEITQVCYNQETFGNTPFATFNIYMNDGSGTVPYQGGGFGALLLGSQQYQTSTADNGMCVCVDFDTPVPINPAITSVWVEVFTPGTTVNSRIVQTPGTCDGNSASGTNTYIAAPACGITAPVLFSSIGFILDASYALTITPLALEAVPDPNAPIGYNAYESGDALPIGTHCFQYTATDGSGNQSTCDWCVVVAEFPEALQTTTLACNDHINVSVDQGCNAVITPDMGLEGGPYGCYETYLVTIAGLPAGAVFGNGTDAVTIDATLIPAFVLNGMAGPFEYSITDPDNANNTCWGTFMLEDKIAPTIVCDTVTVSCVTGTDIGETVFGTSSGSMAASDALAWGDGTTGAVGSISLNTSGAPAGAVTENIKVTIQMDHSWVGDVVLNLEGPNGAVVNIINAQCSINDNVNAVFYDDAPAPISCAGGATAGPHENCPGDYAQFATISQEVQPNGDFADFLGGSSNGTWTLYATDQVGGDGGCISGFTVEVEWAVYSATAPIVDDNCGTLPITYEDVVVDGDCTSEFAQTIYRTWSVDDAKGNGPVSCTQVINVTREDLTSLVVPVNWDGLPGNNPILACDGNWTALPDGNPSPAYTGYPGGVGTCGTISWTYEDIELPICTTSTSCLNCSDIVSYKVLRNWVIVDWCTGEVLEHAQIIKVMDLAAPTFTTPQADITISTDIWGCAATLNLADLDYEVADNCSAFHVSYSTSAGTLVGPACNPTSIVFASPANCKAPVQVVITAEDCCGNKISDAFFVTIEDNVPPVVVADEHTVVTLGADGTAKIYASTFDDGSHDGCGPIGMSVMRMGTNCAPLDYFPPAGDDNTQFNEIVHFCCADIGTPQMVVFRVCDDGDCNGIIGTGGDNCNTAMVEVEVQDKLAPVISCPPNVTINCIDYAALGDLNSLSDAELNAMWGEATAYSTCGGSPDQVLSGTEVCGSGVVNRIFTVTTAGGSSTCIQKIFVQQDVNGDNYLECEDITFPSAPESQYNWCLSASNGGPIQSFNPITVNSGDCGGFNPQAPSINIDDLCTEVGVNVTIDTFAFAGGGCFKYLVHWEVIDQCLFDENYVDPNTGETNPFDTDNGYFHIYVEYDVFDNEGPTVECTEDVIIGCNEDFFAGPLVGAASDNCTDAAYFGWNWKLDANNDFIIDAQGQGQSIPGPFPVGTHRVIWVVSDGCGNTTTEACVFTIEKEDSKAPTPYCYDGLSTAIMQPSACSVTLWAEDFNAGSFDDCGAIDFVSIVPEVDIEGLTPEEAYEASLNLINGVYGWTFDCSYIENGVTAVIEIRMYATDAAGNYDFCVASLRLDDNFDCCEDQGGSKAIGGAVSTEEGEPVSGATVEADAAHSEYPQYQVTEDDGAYAFYDAPQYYDFDITSAKDENYLNGVTTLDLVLIQKHILSIQTLDSPYKLIAADINSDCNVTANDLLELRKLILGLYANDDLPNNQSWRFVDAAYQFQNPSQPCPFDEVIDVDNLTANQMSENFVGVKVGDVNGSAIANATMDAETRNANAITLTVNEAVVNAGEEFSVEFTSADFSDVSGYQFTLGFDNTVAEFAGIEAGALNISEANFGLNRIDEGMITTSWGTVNPVSVDENAVLFTVNFKAVANVTVSEIITLNSRITPAEAYQGANLDVYEVNLEFRTENGVVADAAFELYQNEPNPFDGNTNIGFSLPKAGNATLTVFDVTGKVVHSVRGDFAKGMNTVTLNSNAFNTSGVLYYQLESGEYTATKKMIVLE